MKNQIKNIALLGILVLTGLTSCSEKEPTHEEKIKEVVDVYIADMLKNESILEYSIDSTIINDITQKNIYFNEYLDLRNEALKKMDDAQEYSKQYVETKELIEILANKESSTFKLGLTSMAEYENNANNSMKEAKLLIEDAKAKTKQWETADSLTTIYYEVLANGTITSLKNVQKKGTFPFHISKDYKILKEPLEFRKP